MPDILQRCREAFKQIIKVDLTERMRWHRRELPDMKSPAEREGLPTPKEIAEKMLEELE